MLHMSLILPYVIKDADRKKPFLHDMEVAAALCLAEAKRKKGGILGGSPEKIFFISKLHYPLWAFPWESGSLILDGLGVFSHAIRYMKPPDVETFTEDLKRSLSVRKLYRGVLEHHSQTFKDFTASAQISLEAVVPDEELLSVFYEYVKHGLYLKENAASKLVLIQPRHDENAALKKAEKLVSHWMRIQSEIKGLQYSINVLHEGTNLHGQKILCEIEQVQERYENEILRVKSVVEKAIERLTMALDGKIERMAEAAERKMGAALKKRDGRERKLQKLEQDRDSYRQRKENRKRRGDKIGVSRWGRRIRGCRKKISETKGEIKALTKLVERLRKKYEADVKKLKEDYQTRIYQERKRISGLEASRGAEIAAKQEEIEELRSKTSFITSLIEQLMEQKMLHASKLEELTIPWESERITLICVPFYLVRYATEEKYRYDVHPPAIAEDYEGIIKRIQKALLSFSLESRINLLLRPRSRALKEMLTSTFAKKMREDQALEEVVYGISCSNNLLKAHNFRDKLAKGAKELENEGWISPEEMNLILNAYTPPSADFSQ